MRTCIKRGLDPHNANGLSPHATIGRRVSTRFHTSLYPRGLLLVRAAVVVEAIERLFEQRSGIAKRADDRE